MVKKKRAMNCPADGGGKYHSLSGQCFAILFCFTLFFRDTVSSTLRSRLTPFTLNSWQTSCLCFLSAWITDINLYTCLCFGMSKLFFFFLKSLAWQFMSVTPAFGKQRQEDCLRFQDSWGYIVKPCLKKK